MFEEGLIMSAPTLWFLLGFVFFAAELFLPGFIMVFFGVGAWAAALAAGLGADLALALIIFIGVSVGSRAAPVSLPNVKAKRWKMRETQKMKPHRSCSPESRPQSPEPSPRRQSGK